MFNIDELIIKWGSVGLLDEVPENLKPVLAVKFELTAIYIINHDEILDSVGTTSCIFPIIYRIYNSRKTINDIASFVQEVDQFFINNHEMMQDLNGYNMIDAETHMCNLFVERYESKKGKILEPIKWINKHKL